MEAWVKATDEAAEVRLGQVSFAAAMLYITANHNCVSRRGLTKSEDVKVTLVGRPPAAR